MTDIYKYVNRIKKGFWKSNGSMTPTSVTIHNTYNSAPAKNEISYMLDSANKVSYHYAVDDTSVVQGMDEKRSAWHSDTSEGNNTSIAIEICYSKDYKTDRYYKAENNAAWLAASILHRYGWGIDRLKKHRDWNGEGCPHRILEEGRWDGFKKTVARYLDVLKGKAKLTADMLTNKEGAKSLGASTKPKTTPSASKPSAATTGTLYRVCASAYSDRKSAEAEVAKLKKAGYNAYMIATQAHPKANLEVDGKLGPKTIAALQRYLGTVADGVIDRPSKMVMELQRRLNEGDLK